MVAKKTNRGQAAIELALFLPFVIWLLFYMLNAYNAIHSAQIGETYASMNLYQRLNNRAQFAVDDVAKQLHNRGFMADQYLDMNGNPPQRKIVAGPMQISSIAGVCREPDCK